MYEILEISLADPKRLYAYKLNDIFGADFNIKGFDYPWLISSHAWEKGENVLDVGGAYSKLPIWISKAYGCNVWVADDFGIDSNEPFWTRGRSPEEHIAAHPQIKFILERLGDPPKSSLPESFFDVIYSASALEHVPGNYLSAVWKHMDLLLKPEGELLHAVDMPLPTNFGIVGLLKVLVMDWFFPVMPRTLKSKYFRISPKTYTRLVLKALKIPKPSLRSLGMLNMAINPEVFTDGYEHGFNRIAKDHAVNYRFQREGVLLIRLKKIS
jgi:ubiquinone/menaquinone biosynthesis C-methylase UbiE